MLQKMNEQKDDNLPCYSIRSTSIHKEVKNCIEDILHKTSKNLKNNQIFNAMKLLENYLPDIMKSVHEKLKKADTSDWTQNE